MTEDHRKTALEYAARAKEAGETESYMTLVRAIDAFLQGQSEPAQGPSDGAQAPSSLGRKRHDWNGADGERFRELWNLGVPNGKIAEEFGVTYAQVSNIRRRLNLPAKRTKGDKSTKVRRRFEGHEIGDPESVTGLRADHDAVTEGRTLFPSTVVDPKDSPRVLVSGANSRKLGDRVSKGPWKGMPIYQLSLEERATCPSTCFHWRTCYGNGMPRARRHKHGDELIEALQDELQELQKAHPDGFVVRLHVLGDFYSVEYVLWWVLWLDWFPALHIFGYTAHEPDSEIGKEIAFNSGRRWDRFAIRFSSAESGPQRVTTIFRQPEGANVDEGLVCPAERDANVCCGSCGLCWSENAKDKTIVFVAHGELGRKSKAEKGKWLPSDRPLEKPERTDPKPEESIAAVTVIQTLEDHGHQVQQYGKFNDRKFALDGNPAKFSKLVELADKYRARDGKRPFSELVTT